MAQGEEGRGSPPQLQYRSLIFNYLLFASLGIVCSIIYNSYYGTYRDIDQKLNLFSSQAQFSLKEVKSILQGTNCEDVERESKIPDRLKDCMGTKLCYQFESVTSNKESTVGNCHALKVYGLLRHGTRYPTAKHLKKWIVLQQGLSEKLTGSTSDMARALLNWPNQLGRDVAEGKAKPSELAQTGMREQYCLGKRFRERFPSISSHSYSPLSYAFRSTMTSRAEKSALSFADGLFEETNPEVISMTTVEEIDDVLLRYDELPCPKYDQKVTYNSSLKEWMDTFLSTSTFQKAVKNVQQHFNPDYWKLSAQDVLIFYQICIHEMSILGESSWCDLFGTEDLSVMEYYSDLRAYWIKAGGYPITWQRSVHLVQSMLDFLVNGKESVALSFAHAETLLPLLTLFKTFPVSHALTPTNYDEMISRDFVTSRIAPYSANAYLVLYNCIKDYSSGTQLFVSLLVNEKPVKIGLCDDDTGRASDCHVTGKGDHVTEEEDGQCQQESFLCGLDYLRERAYDITNSFSTLTELCKATTYI